MRKTTTNTFRVTMTKEEIHKEKQIRKILEPPKAGTVQDSTLVQNCEGGTEIRSKAHGDPWRLSLFSGMAKTADSGGDRRGRRHDSCGSSGLWARSATIGLAGSLWVPLLRRRWPEGGAEGEFLLNQRFSR